MTGLGTTVTLELFSGVGGRTGMFWDRLFWGEMFWERLFWEGMTVLGEIVLGGTLGENVLRRGSVLDCALA